MITLANLKDATAQQIFDQVATHLLTQNKQSMKSGDVNVCLYRNGEGLKCAAGCLIGDDEYKPEMDSSGTIGGGTKVGSGWGRLVERGLVPSEHEELITSLQRVHDAYLPTHWGVQLANLANRFDLTFNASA